MASPPEEHPLASLFEPRTWAKGVELAARAAGHLAAYRDGGTEIALLDGDSPVRTRVAYTGKTIETWCTCSDRWRPEPAGRCTHVVAALLTAERRGGRPRWTSSSRAAPIAVAARPSSASSPAASCS